MCKCSGKFNDENTIRNHNAGHHDYAHQRHDVQCASGDQKDHDDSCQSRWNRHENDERIDKRGELGHQDQVNHQHRKNESDPKFPERPIHTDYRAAEIEHCVLVGLGVRQIAC